MSAFRHDVYPGTCGSSRMFAKNLSNIPLKLFTLHSVMSLKYFGNALNNFPPCTANEDSRAFCTKAGDDVLTGGMSHRLPCLSGREHVTVDTKFRI